MRRARRRPGRPDRRLPAGQAGKPVIVLEADGPGRRPRARPIVTRGLPLRPRRPPLLHQGQGGRRPLARDHAATSSSCARASRASTGTSKFLDYPLQGHGRHQEARPGRADARRSLSYLWAAIKPKGREDNLEQWVSNRFGKRLFNLFFKSYTEKVWGVPTTEIRAEWAAQRIKGLSFFSAAKAAFFGNRGNKIKSLIDEFNYPRYGPGQMWETMTDEIRGWAARCASNAPVTRLAVDGRPRGRGRRAGGETLIEPSARDLLAAAAHDRRASPSPTAPGEVRDAAARAALPRLPHRRARDRRRGPLPRQLDLHPRAGRARSAASRTSARGARGWSPTRPRRASASSTSASRATTCGRWTTTSSSSSATQRARAARPGQGRQGQARLRRARAQGLPDVRRRLRRARRRRSAAGSRHRRTSSRSAATACTATTTPTTRC